MNEIKLTDMPYPGVTEIQPVPGQMIPLSSFSSKLPDVPGGLNYLTTIDHLFVKQKVELFEAFTGFETNNKYSIFHDPNQQLFFAAEKNDCCNRNCCGPIRSFDIEIRDAVSQQEVLHVSRPLRCQACCFPCCLQELEVSVPQGGVLGSIVQNWSIIYPNFSVKNESGEIVMKIEGPCWTCSCGGDVKFDVMTLDGQVIGNISKKWSGFGKELFTDADNFGIQFPMDLDVKMKAVLLGACFLIDFMFFEESNQNNR